MDLRYRLSENDPQDAPGYEEWSPWPAGQGLYLVSTLGRIWSRQRGGKMLALPTRGDKRHGFYRKVKVSGQWQSVHVLVAETFHGERPPGALVRHLDGDSLNNCADNLAWGTSKQNAQDKDDHGTNFWRNRTHCSDGHEYTPENTLRLKNGDRVCRACNRRRDRERRARERARM